MTHLSESIATFRISGDELVPDEISASLGVEPSRAQRKGEEIVGNKTGQIRIAKSGLGLLRTEDRKPEDIDGQVIELFKRMNPDPSI